MKAQAITRSKAGDLVVSGSGRDPDEAGGDDVPGFAIARFDADGSPDESFGSDGRVHTYFPGTTRYASALAVATQADGRIVATGQVVDNRGGGTRFLPVTRYKRNGSPDRSFGVDGLVKLKLHGGESGSAVKVLPEGRILVAGQDDHDPVVIRLKPDGRLDRKFGKRGIARPRLEERPRFGKGNVIYTPQREATAMVLLPGGGILAGAAAYNRSLQAGVVFGLRANGKPRRRFGRKGIRYTGGLSPNSLSLDRCRRLLVSGAYHRGYHTQSRFGVARIKLNGAADRRFGHGKTLLPFGRKSASGAAGSTRSGRSVVVAGFRERPSTNYDFALASFSVGKRCR